MKYSFWLMIATAKILFFWSNCPAHSITTIFVTFTFCISYHFPEISYSFRLKKSWKISWQEMQLFFKSTSTGVVCSQGTKYRIRDKPGGTNTQEVNTYHSVTSIGPDLLVMLLRVCIMISMTASLNLVRLWTNKWSEHEQVRNHTILKNAACTPFHYQWWVNPFMTFCTLVWCSTNLFCLKQFSNWVSDPLILGYLGWWRTPCERSRDACRKIWIKPVYTKT